MSFPFEIQALTLKERKAAISSLTSKELLKMLVMSGGKKVDFKKELTPINWKIKIKSFAFNNGKEENVEVSEFDRDWLAQVKKYDNSKIGLSCTLKPFF